MTGEIKNSGSSPPPPATKVLGRKPRVVRKRFYTAVAVVPFADGFTVHLDGRGVKTPRTLPLLVPCQPLTQAIANEWAAQAAEIAPATMPLTTLVCTAIDAVAGEMPAVAAETGRYAMSDLLCYRADAPDGLVAQQTAGWDPVLAWASGTLGVTFARATGLMPVAQSPEVAAAVVAALAPLDPLRLAAVHVLTTLMGSAVLALAVWRQHFSLDEAWRLAHLDEDWQIARWGTDAEAEARRAARLVSARAADQVLRLVG